VSGLEIPQTQNAILLIDDTPDHLELMGSLLRRAGFRVLTAGDAREGIRVARRECPDLVISDVVMPSVSGIELCQMIRADADLATIPVLLVSALDKDTDSIVEALQTGADGYIEMPFEPSLLVAKVVRLLERKGAEEELERRVTERTEQLAASNQKLEEEKAERERSEQALLASEQLLQQSQKMEAIGTLAGGVAHDFNNLLTVILGNTHLAFRTLQPDDPLQLRLVEVEKAANRATVLTRQLLAFSRRQHLERRTINLNVTIGEIMKLLQRIIGEDVDVRVTTTPSLCAIFADPAQIEQVIMNLAVNARDAMPQGGQLTIETSNVELDENYQRQYPYVEPGRYAQITVSDTGSGMDAETQKRIFEPFFTTKEVDHGTGLGLSMVYGIVKQHDGHINVYSKVGHGTTFKIYLPVVESAVETEAPIIQPPLLGGTETILVAEDEEALRGLARDVLEGLGYKVLLAKNGEEAVEVYGQNREQVSLLLLDVVMPRMGGWEAYERIRELGGDVPLIFMTGYSSETVQSRFVKQNKSMEESGAVVLQKPYNVEGLGRKIREVLDEAGKQTC
jgi:signal transduction histidine kinase